MDTGTSPLAEHKIGQVYTPLKWAQWLIDSWQVFDAWIDGASICDPTAGEGVFAIALLKLAREKNVCVTNEMVERIFLIELCSLSLKKFQVKAREEYNIEFPDENLICQDIILTFSPTSFDIIVGNPPWSNFTDLPDAYKEKLKSHFVIEGLVPDRRKVLLGSSRTDLAALVVKKILGKLLKPRGRAILFVPSSLFLGDDAHRGFRNYAANGRPFSVRKVFEFSTTDVFVGIGTQYCCAEFLSDQEPIFPVSYMRECSAEWVEHQAYPLKAKDDQWRVLPIGSTNSIEDFVNITLQSHQQPRQGVNTCGANDVFIFDEYPNALPRQFLFPLLIKEHWTGREGQSRWILLPYNQHTGKPLSWKEIESHPELADYLNKHKSSLRMRKGTMIRSTIEKGAWWALLGVGVYSFAPYKVAWQAYGKKEFRPIVVSSVLGLPWQGNQAMHAFIPCWSEIDANRIKDELDSPLVTEFLKQLNGEGKCNWAQPGKIKKLLSLRNAESIQTSLL